jgi:hypothetical protein
MVISSFYLPLIIVGSGRHGGQKVGSRVSSFTARDLARHTAAIKRKVLQVLYVDFNYRALYKVPSKKKTKVTTSDLLTLFLAATTDTQHERHNNKHHSLRSTMAESSRRSSKASGTRSSGTSVRRSTRSSEEIAVPSSRSSDSRSSGTGRRSSTKSSGQIAVPSGLRSVVQQRLLKDVFAASSGAYLVRYLRSILVASLLSLLILVSCSQVLRLDGSCGR